MSSATVVRDLIENLTHVSPFCVPRRQQQYESDAATPSHYFSKTSHIKKSPTVPANDEAITCAANGPLTRAYSNFPIATAVSLMRLEQQDEDKTMRINQ